MKRLLLLVLLWGLGSSFAAEVQILYTCDLHGSIQRLTHLAPAIRAGQPEALRIDGGDLVSGNCLAEYSQGRIMTAALNALNYDVWVPGNHEFELGYPAFLARVRDFKGAVLGADWHYCAIRPAAWKIFRRSGVKIAVIGLGDPKMPRRLLPENPAHFLPPETAVRTALRELRAYRPEIIVLVWHHGVYYPPFLSQMLRKFPEIDLALAAHTHQEIPGKRYGHSFVVQAGSHARCVADIRIDFDDDRRQIREITAQLRRPEPAQTDAELQTILNRYKAQYYPQLFQTLPGFPTEFRRPLPGEFNLELGNFIADKLRRLAQCQGAVLLLPNGRDRQVKAPNLWQLHRIMPYRNELYRAQLRRSEIIALVNWMERAGKKMNQTPFYAGIKVHRRKNGQVQSIETPREMTVALNNYLLISVPELRALLHDQPARYFSCRTVEREALLPRELLSWLAGNCTR